MFFLLITLLQILWIKVAKPQTLEKPEANSQQPTTNIIVIGLYLSHSEILVR